MAPTHEDFPEPSPGRVLRNEMCRKLAHRSVIQQANQFYEIDYLIVEDIVLSVPGIQRYSLPAMKIIFVQKQRHILLTKCNLSILHYNSCSGRHIILARNNSFKKFSPFSNLAHTILSKHD